MSKAKILTLKPIFDWSPKFLFMEQNTSRLKTKWTYIDRILFVGKLMVVLLPYMYNYIILALISIKCLFIYYVECW